MTDNEKATIAALKDRWTDGDRYIAPFEAAIVLQVIDRLSSAPGWRAIEEHPGDHFQYNVYSMEHGGMFTAFIDATGQWWLKGAEHPLGFIPTHFRPLPSPPPPDTKP